MSHRGRAPLVRRFGTGGFLGVYVLVAGVTLLGVAIAYRRAAASAPLWPVGDWLWGLVSAVMLLATMLLMGSLVGNPALPGAVSAAPATASGVYAITRHPMMWSIALWGLCHIAVYPAVANIIVALAMIVLALAGAALQDRKKEVLQPEIWRAWESRTSFWPFAAMVAGRARWSGIGMHALAGGTVIWLAATWAHIPLSGWAAGIWRWL